MMRRDYTHELAALRRLVENHASSDTRESTSNSFDELIYKMSRSSISNEERAQIEMQLLQAHSKQSDDALPSDNAESQSNHASYNFFIQICAMITQRISLNDLRRYFALLTSLLAEFASKTSHWAKSNTKISSLQKAIFIQGKRIPQLQHIGSKSYVGLAISVFLLIIASIHTKIANPTSKRNFPLLYPNSAEISSKTQQLENMKNISVSLLGLPESFKESSKMQLQGISDANFGLSAVGSSRVYIEGLGWHIITVSIVPEPQN